MDIDDTIYPIRFTLATREMQRKVAHVLENRQRQPRPRSLWQQMFGPSSNTPSAQNSRAASGGSAQEMGVGAEATEAAGARSEL